jgi:two-component system, NarL family, nitrate/nitrite response regulator NarL
VLGCLVIVITIVPDQSYIAAVTESGASAYVSKADRVGGRSALTADRAFWLARDSRVDRPHLSERERQVLVAYGNGMTVDAVGRMFGIASGTVRAHLCRVEQKYIAAGRPIKHRGQYGRTVWTRFCRGARPAR